MNLVLRLIFFLIGQQAKLRLLREAKRRGVIAYLRALQGTRFALMGALAGFLILQLMMISFAGAVVTGVWLAPLEQETKIQILFGVFATLFFVPLIGLCIAFSERLWYRASGAEKLVEKIQSGTQG